MRQLYYFIKVAELGSITDAAEALFISKQSLSEAITKLEQNFNVQLFNRSRNGMSLTDVGQYFYEDALGIVQRVDALHKKYGTRTIANESIVRLVAFSGIASLIISPVFQKLAETGSSVQIRFTEFCYPEEGLNALITCKADIGLFSLAPFYLSSSILSQRTIWEHLDTLKLFEDRLCILAHKKFKLTEKRYVTYEDYAELPLVVYEPYKTIYPTIYKGHQRAADSMVIVNSLNTYRQLINEGLAVGCSTALLIPEMIKQYPGISCSMDMTPEAAHTIILAKTKNHELSLAAQQVWDIIAQIIYKFGQRALGHLSDPLSRRQ